MIKLLLVSPKTENSKGGIAVWTKQFLESCPAHGVSCHLVNTEMVGRRKNDGTARRSFTDEFIRTIRIFGDLKSALNDHTFDVAHLNTSCGTFGLFRDYLVAKQIKRKNIRLITHFHCDIPYWIKNSVSKKCLKKLASFSDENLVLCESSRLYLESQFGISSSKVPNFVDETVIRKDEKYISEKISKAFFVGRVEEAKGAKEMYELAKRFPEIRFRLAGAVSDTVMVWDKPANIELIGPKSHDEVLKEMDAADVFVFPSHSEGFSLALTEAMARGLPCIATDVGAAKDMLEDKCGVIVSVGDINEMESSFRTMDSWEFRKRASVKSKLKAIECYSTNSVLKVLRFYYAG